MINRAKKQSVYASRTPLRTAGDEGTAPPPVFINEHLAASNASIFKQVRALKKSKNVKQAYTFD